MRSLYVVIALLIPCQSSLSSGCRGQAGGPGIADPLEQKAAPRPGSNGLGDPIYPGNGNGGYDALHYSVVLSVTLSDAGIHVSGDSTMTARAIEPLESFNLDFVGYSLEEVRVNGSLAHVDRTGMELVTTPGATIEEGDVFEVRTRFEGTPQLVEDPALPFLEGLGWMRFGEGVHFLGHPSGTHSCFPLNDHPIDKATYSVQVTVAKPLVAVCNGVLVETREDPDERTFSWESRDPLSASLFTINIADLEVQTDTGPDGVSIRNYFPASLSREARDYLDATKEQLQYFSGLFGPYPFEVIGSLVFEEDDLSIALETQTLMLHSSRSVRQDRERTILAHELAHQWFGNSVSIEQWPDIWIYEGLASYAETLWIEHEKGKEIYGEEISRWYAQMSTGEPTFRLPREDMMGILDGEGNEALTLTRAQVEEMFRGFLDESEVDGMLSRVSDAGIAGQDLAALIEMVDFEPIEYPSSRLKRVFSHLGLDQMARQLPPPYVPPGKASAEHFFTDSIYKRGALVFAALRARVGDQTFFGILRAFAERHRHRNASTADLVSIASEISGTDLLAFFDSWLYDDAVPPIPELDLRPAPGPSAAGEY